MYDPMRAILVQIATASVTQVQLVHLQSFLEQDGIPTMRGALDSL